MTVPKDIMQLMAGKFLQSEDCWQAGRILGAYSFCGSLLIDSESAPGSSCWHDMKSLIIIHWMKPDHIVLRTIRLAKYNERANSEMYAAVALLTEKAWKRNVASWFVSIHGILNHIIICDMNWLKRYRRLDLDSAVLKDLRLDSPNLSWEHALHQDLLPLAEERKAIDRLLIQWFADFPGTRYGEIFEYTDSSGVPRKAIAGDAFDFLFTHQIHHRGQVSQILDQFGLQNNYADNGRFFEEGMTIYQDFKSDRAD